MVNKAIGAGKKGSVLCVMAYVGAHLDKATRLSGNSSGLWVKRPLTLPSPPGEGILFPSVFLSYATLSWTIPPSPKGAAFFSPLRGERVG
jgi:hypothetical protein